MIMDPTTVVLLLGAAVPLLVAVVTKKFAEPWVKVATNVAATALVAALAHLVTSNGVYDLAGFWGAFVHALAASGLAYMILWKNTLGLALENATADFGLGSVALAPVPASQQVAVNTQGGLVVVPVDLLPAPPVVLGDVLD